MKSKAKLRTYVKYKSVLKLESYLKNEDAIGRMMIARIISGTNNLRIETGRYNNMKVEHRICRLCNSAVEDEEHFLNECKIYEDIRNECIKEFAINKTDEDINNIMFGKVSDIELTHVIRFIRRAMARRHRILRFLTRKMSKKCFYY